MRLSVLRSLLRDPRPLIRSGNDVVASATFITALEQRVLLSATTDPTQIDSGPPWHGEALSDGGTVLLYKDDVGIVSRRTFDADGNPTGTTSLGHTSGSVIVAGPGGHVVTFYDGMEFGEDDEIIGILKARVAGPGGAFGSEIEVLRTTAGSVQPWKAVIDASGIITLLINFNDGTGTASASSARLVRMTSGGAVTDYRVLGGAGHLPQDIDLLEDGSVFVTWKRNDLDAWMDPDFEYRTFGRWYSASGSPIGGVMNLGEHVNQIEWAEMADGTWLAAWTAGGVTDIFAQRFESDRVTPVGGPALVNRTFDGFQTTPRIAVRENGDYVILWYSDFMQSVGGPALSGQGFLANHTPVGGEFALDPPESGNHQFPHFLRAVDDEFEVVFTQDRFSENAKTYIQRMDPVSLPDIGTGPETRATLFVDGDQLNPAIAVNSAGRTVIAYQSADVDGGDILFQIYNELGEPIGPHFLTHDETSGTQQKPAVALAENGEFVILWEESDGSGLGIYGQRFRANGGRLGGRFRANTSTSGSQSAVAVDYGTDGTFTVVWQSANQDGHGLGVYGQRYVNNVRTGGEFRVHNFVNGNQFAPDIALDGRNIATVVWASRENSRIALRRFAADGAALGQESSISGPTSGPTFAPSIDVNTRGQGIVAWDVLNPTTGRDVYVRRLHADGTPLSDAFLAHTIIAGDQTAPDVAIGPRGNFVVVWSGPTDGDGSAIFGRAFLRSGVPLDDGEGTVNSYQSGDQTAVAVDMDETLRPVLVWQSAGQDGDGESVVAVQFPGAFTSEADQLIGLRNGSQWRIGGPDPIDGFETETVATWGGGANWHSVVYGDFDGNSLTDVAARSASGHWWVGLSDGESLTATSWTRWGTGTPWENITVGDFNGDGKDDIVGRNGAGHWVLSASDGDGFTTASIGRWNPANNWQSIVFGDFDGNGATDIAGRAGNGTWWVGLNDVREDGRMQTTAWGRWSTGANWQNIGVGDFNGDGRDDVIGRTSAGTWWIGESTGSRFVNAVGGSWDRTLTWQFVAFVDLDGDGYDDIIGLTTGGVWRRSRLVEGRAKRFGTRSVVVGDWSDSSWRDVTLGDFDGDGLVDVAARDGSSQWRIGFSTQTTLESEDWEVWSGSWTGIGAGKVIG